jgi:guanosine-3',5'-bis(diphosphate) 3'-pyrophosphohydrolase
VIEAEFGEPVAELVDGVTKLDKLHFRDRQEAAAESFRKMLLAMARDLRVILIKLADRLHNMRTLDAMATESRRRIARETLDIYAPIAQRLGMNKIKAELQDLGFKRPVSDSPRGPGQANRGASRYCGVKRWRKIEAALAQKLAQEGLPNRLVGRVKSPFSIYIKMKSEQKSLDQVMDVFGFRVVVRAP